MFVIFTRTELVGFRKSMNSSRLQDNLIIALQLQRRARSRFCTWFTAAIKHRSPSLFIMHLTLLNAPIGPHHARCKASFFQSCIKCLRDGSKQGCLAFHNLSLIVFCNFFFPCYAANNLTVVQQSNIFLCYASVLLDSNRWRNKWVVAVTQLIPRSQHQSCLHLVRCSKKAANMV